MLRVAVQPEAITDARVSRHAAMELQRIARAISLAVVDPTRPFASIVIATDASPWLGAVCWAAVKPSHAATFLEGARHTKGLHWRVNW